MVFSKSYELFIRFPKCVLDFVNNGGSKAETSRQFSISRGIIYQWLNVEDPLTSQKPGPQGSRCLDYRALKQHIAKRDAFDHTKDGLAEVSNVLLEADPLYTATQVATWQRKRKIAIEPVFDLLSKLLSITGAPKPLPLRGVAYVSAFLDIGVLLLQLSMLMKVQCGLLTRNITYELIASTRYEWLKVIRKLIIEYAR
ncbi:hypothetical protein F4054_10615 [Candidatus Poribacteria bacterium]|nr:hypothetical protein [Candidatus Poribacteria bacterium]MYG05266.1 hypothetical protein [Candidatus Poribacteria bacterium]MYK22699.1 hypothetical protein [Candidatus Poribacteria bacterium]